MRSREEIIRDNSIEWEMPATASRHQSDLILEVLLDTRDLLEQRQKEVWAGAANIPPSELFEAFAKILARAKKNDVPQEERFRRLDDER